MRPFNVTLSTFLDLEVTICVTYLYFSGHYFEVNSNFDK